MEYRNLGRSGLRLSAIGLGGGSGSFAGKADEATAQSIIHRALDLGITFFDTAETYAEGRSEQLFGKALKSQRSEVVIATKFGKARSVGPSEQRGSRSRVVKALEGSLRRLDTDYVDLYVLHEPDPSTPIEETLSALDDQVRLGKVRYIGCSDFPAWRLCEALWTSKTDGIASFAAAGAVYNLMRREVELDLVPCCEAYGIGVVATMPLSQGFLTGKYRRGEPAPEGTRFGSPPPYSAAIRQDLSLYNRHLTDEAFQRLELLTAFAERRGRTIAELAIGWLLSQPWIGAVPVGVSSPEQIERNLRGLDWQLSEDEKTEIDSIP